MVKTEDSPNQKINFLDYNHVNIRGLRNRHCYAHDLEEFIEELKTTKYWSNEMGDRLGLNPDYNSDRSDLLNNSKIALFHDDYNSEDTAKCQNFSILCPYCSPFPGTTHGCYSDRAKSLFDCFFPVAKGGYSYHMSMTHGVFPYEFLIPQPFVGEAVAYYTIGTSHIMDSKIPKWSIVCPHTCEEDNSKACLASFDYKPDEQHPLSEYLAHFYYRHMEDYTDPISVKHYRSVDSYITNTEELKENYFSPADLEIHIIAQTYLTEHIQEKDQVQPFVLPAPNGRKLALAQSKVINAPKYHSDDYETNPFINDYEICCLCYPPFPTDFVFGSDDESESVSTSRSDLSNLTAPVPRRTMMFTVGDSDTDDEDEDGDWGLTPINRSGAKSPIGFAPSVTHIENIESQEVVEQSKESNSNQEILEEKSEQKSEQSANDSTERENDANGSPNDALRLAHKSMLNLRLFLNKFRSI